MYLYAYSLLHSTCIGTEYLFYGGLSGLIERLMRLLLLSLLLLL